MGGSEQVRSISIHNTLGAELSGSPKLRYIPECIPALVESLCFFLAEDGHLALLDRDWILLNSFQAWQGASQLAHVSS